MKPERKMSGILKITFLDHFLPKPSAKDDRLRSYLTVATLLFSLSVILINLFHCLFSETGLGVTIATLILFIMTGGCIVALKLGVKQELVTGLFHFILTSTLTVILSSFCGSFLAPGIFFFLLSIMHASLFSSNRWAIVQSLYVVLGTLIVFWKTADIGLSIPFNWAFDVYVDRLRFVLINVCLSTYLAMVIHESFQRNSERELTQERDWLLHSSRLHEVSILAESLSFQIYSPLREFGRDFSRMRHALGSESFDTLEVERVANMHRSVEELIQISRSFDWIYRSHKHDNLAGASIELLLRHLRVLLEGKALENGWALRFQSDCPDYQMRGDIPSLMLLLVTLAHRNFDRYSASSTMALDIMVTDREEAGKPEVEWQITWPRTAEKTLFIRFDSARGHLAEMIDEIRESLIDELTRDCGARLVPRDSATHHELSIIFPHQDS